MANWSGARQGEEPLGAVGDGDDVAEIDGVVVGIWEGREGVTVA